MVTNVFSFLAATATQHVSTVPCYTATMIKGLPKADVLPVNLAGISKTNKRVLKKVSQIVKPNLQTGPWIAGGSVRRLYEGEDIRRGDIDVFVANDEQSKRVLNDLNDSGQYTVQPHHSGCQDFVHSSGLWKVQVILIKHYETLNDLIADFDISVSQFATDGKIIVTTSAAITDCYTRTFRFVGRVTKGFKRLRKYIAYGFLPHDSVWDTIMEKSRNSLIVDGKILDGADY